MDEWLRQLASISSSTTVEELTRVSTKKDNSKAHAASRMKPVKTFKPIMKDQTWMTAKQIAELVGRKPHNVTESMRKLMALKFVGRRKRIREYEYIWYNKPFSGWDNG